MLTQILQRQQDYLTYFIDNSHISLDIMEKTKKIVEDEIKDLFSDRTRNIDLPSYHDKVNQLYALSLGIIYRLDIAALQTESEHVARICKYSKKIKDSELELRTQIYNIKDRDFYAGSIIINDVIRIHINLLLNQYYYNHYCHQIKDKVDYSIVNLLFPQKPISKSVRITKEWFCPVNHLF